MNRVALSRVASRTLRRSSLQGARRSLPLSPRPGTASLIASSSIARRLVSTTPHLAKGILPDSENPPAKQSVEAHPLPTTPADITDSQYHELADELIENMLLKFEQLQDEHEDVDIEYAAGVLNLTIPSIGTYVVNKQPPNKQIWLSSPKSGPKRYDWVILGDGQDQKEGTATGDWIYLRDGSSLNKVFFEELNVDLTMPIAHVGELKRCCCFNCKFRSH